MRFEEEEEEEEVEKEEEENKRSRKMKRREESGGECLDAAILIPTLVYLGQQLVHNGVVYPSAPTEGATLPADCIKFVKDDDM